MDSTDYLIVLKYAVPFLALLLLFGGKKLPELMKGIGQGLQEFKKATKEDKEKDKEDDQKKLKDSAD